MKPIPAAVADKLSKIIPRLASTHDAEVLATVAAIRRTLETADLDLHDLAKGIIADPFDIRAFTTAPAPTWTPPSPAAPPRRDPFYERTAAEWAEANRKMQEREDARRARLTPWPTFSRLSHFARCALLDRAAAEMETIASMLSTPDRAAFKELRTKIRQRPQEIPVRREMNLYNRISKAVWDMDHGGKEQTA